MLTIASPLSQRTQPPLKITSTAAVVAAVVAAVAAVVGFVIAIVAAVVDTAAMTTAIIKIISWHLPPTL